MSCCINMEKLLEAINELYNNRAEIIYGQFF